MNIIAYRELSRSNGRKLVELTFEDPGYPVGDSSHRPTDVWDLPDSADVLEEIAAFLEETSTTPSINVDADPVAVTAKALEEARAQRAARKQAEQEQQEADELTRQEQESLQDLQRAVRGA